MTTTERSESPVGMPSGSPDHVGAGPPAASEHAGPPQLDPVDQSDQSDQSDPAGAPPPTAADHGGSPVRLPAPGWSPPGRDRPNADSTEHPPNAAITNERPDDPGVALADASHSDTCTSDTAYSAIPRTDTPNSDPLPSDTPRPDTPRPDPSELVPVDLLSGEAAHGARIRLLGYPEDRIATEWRSDLPAECTTYYDAYAMPIASADDSTRQLVGALYAADGTLITESQRAKTNLTWHGNPERLRRKPGLRTERLEGRTYFAGHYRSIFGHMLLEILPRFWPDLDYTAYDTFLFHPQRAGRRASHLLLESYGDDLLGAATGGSQADLRIVAGRPLRIAELTVATPGVWLKDGFSPVIRRVFERVADRLVGTDEPAGEPHPRRVYLSRSELRSRHRKAENEVDVEDLMRTAGFTVVHPQTLSVREQVALVRGAEVIAGCDGSALHLAVFARPGTTLVALDSRPVPNQFLVDHIAGLNAVHVLATADYAVHGRADVWEVSLPLVRAALAVASVD